MSGKERIKQWGYGNTMSQELCQKGMCSRNSDWKVYWKAGQSELHLFPHQAKLIYRPKMKHQPYMQITLSTKPLGLEEGVKGRNVTCQYVMTRRKKPRMQRRVTKAEVEEEDTALSTKKDESDNQKEKLDQLGKDQGEKRKIGSSQASATEGTRGGKKRKK